MPSAIALAAAAWFSEPFAPAPAPADLPDELAGEPDLYLEQAFITQYQSNGEIKYELDAKRIRHFDRNNLTRLTAPIFTLHNQPQPPWRIDSDHGYIRRQEGTTEEVVFLRQNVSLQQRFDDGRHLRLTSPSLYLYPDRQYAKTEQAVMIDTEVGRTTAVGLQGELQRGLLKLFSSEQQRVHTIILPGQFK